MAELVAERLGYELFDKRILRLIAKQTRVSTDWVEYFEGQVGSKFQKIMNSKSAKKKLEAIVNENCGVMTQEIYIDNLNSTLMKIAEKGDAVILGRGCQYILTDNGDVLHVLLVAERNDVVVEFALNRVGSPLAVGTYAYTALPPEVRAALPSEDQLAGAMAQALDQRRGPQEDA